MAGRAGDATARSRTQPARGRRQTTASLPLDVLVDIAARSDPATLVRCAATCVDMRCRIKDETGLRGRLRLRHGDRVDAGCISYVLLIGGEDNEGVAAIGRHFQLIIAYLELSQHHHRRHLQLLTFSSEHGVWGRCTKVWAPNLCGSYLQGGLGRALVIGGTLHWLCMSNTSACMFKLHVKTAHFTVTMLPESFGRKEWVNHLLATSSVGKSLIVLVTDGNKIWAWSKQTAKWQQRPEAVIEKDAISRFLDKEGGNRPVTKPGRLSLVCLAERSGTVLISSGCSFFWLNLRSMEIVRSFSDSRLQYIDKNIPYEMNLTAWVPTFGSSL